MPVIDSPFWSPRLRINAENAIFHQLNQLEASGCIENFRIAAGLKKGLREGWFFADSDAYKWLEAAARVYALQPDRALKSRMDDLITLLARAQMPDGYLYTYSQIHFPGSRWENLFIEHELYCLGHLIEAAVSHHEVTGEVTFLSLARKAADLLVKDFLKAGPSWTDGHEEIEIALLRLHQATGHAEYLDLATALLERRGRTRPFFPLLLRQNARVEKRKQVVKQQREAYITAHPEFVPFQVPAGNYAKVPKNSRLRWLINAMTGKYFQMNTPIKKQTVPVGHSVRFGYLETATAMLCRLAPGAGTDQLVSAMEKAWERMVTRRMYATGGVGAVPGLEGFGRDDELDPETAYAETCAALACMFWNWEMAQITHAAKYSDLFEWQLYNAAAPGMGLDGKGYLYNNPLASHGGVMRRPWFAVPCCPSNLSRTWASLGKYIYSSDDNNIWIHQYIGSRWTAKNSLCDIQMASDLPGGGTVRIALDPAAASKFSLHFRIPSWAPHVSIRINDQPLMSYSQASSVSTTACGYDPRLSSFLPITRTWLPGDVIELDFEVPILLHHASKKVRGHKDKVVVSRGPVVYCLESVDNPGLDIFTARLDPSSLQITYSPTLLDGTQPITAQTAGGQPLTFIPYHLWANRGESQMTVWINS